MKFLVIIAAVVLTCQAAKVPQEVTHQVTVPVPSSVLAPPSSVKDTPKAQISAQVVEVSKENVPKADVKEYVMTTVQPEVKSMMSTVVEMKRQTRAVMPTVQADDKPAEMTTANVPEAKTVMPTVLETKRKTRAVMTTMQPEVKTVKPTVLELSTVPKADTKTTVMPTVQPETKTVMPTEVERKRNVRAVMTTLQPAVVKTNTVQEEMPKVDKKTVSMTTMQPETKSVMPTVTEMNRKTRAVMTTMQPDEKMTVPTVVPTAAKVDTKAVVMSTVQPERIPVMPSVTEIIRKTRAVPFTDNSNKKVPRSSDCHRSIRSVKDETTTVLPVTTDPSVTVTENLMVKSSEVASNPSTQSAIDPCDLLCTKFEFEPICATNGLCQHEFPNQCILDTFNCKHPKGKFTATKDDRCQMDWLTKCEESDMV